MKLILDDGTEVPLEIIPGNCAVIASPDSDDPEEVKRLAKALEGIPIFRDHHISVLTAPRSIKWTVIRDGIEEKNTTIG